MAVNVRKTPLGARHEINQIIAKLNALSNCAIGYANIANGTTAGKLKTTNTTGTRFGTLILQKAATDDLWAFAAETALTAGQYRAYWLAVDSAGAAIAVASTRGTVGATAALALAGLPPILSTWCVIGVYVAGSAGTTDFTAALAAQGTIYNGIPDGASLVQGAPTGVYGVGDFITSVNP